MALYDPVDGVYRKVAKKYDPVDGVHRAVTKAFDPVDGVYRQYFSSGVPWRKYSCDVNKTTTTTYEETSVGVGETGSDKDTGSVILYARCVFGADTGWVTRGQNSFDAEDVDTLRSKAVGMYTESYGTGGGQTKACQVTAITSCYVNTQGILIFEYEYEVVGCAVKHTTNSTTYEQGDTDYGTVYVPEGELPECDYHVEGNDDYCVVVIDGTYYYYVKEE